MGHAWFSPSGDEVDEEQLKLVSGETTLLFERKTGKIRVYTMEEVLKGLGKK